jgi:hypothetical protein
MGKRRKGKHGKPANQRPQDKPLENINRELASDPLEVQWFAAGDRMKAKPQPKREWE